MKYEECAAGMWVMARLPNDAVYPARILRMPDVESGSPYICIGVEGRVQAGRWWNNTNAVAVKFEDLLYRIDVEQFGSHHIVATKAYRVGCRLIDNLNERIRACHELTRHKLPLPAYTRAAMQPLYENENRLDELIAEVVTDLLNARSDGE